MKTLTVAEAKAVSEQYGTAIAPIYDEIYGELDIASPEIAELRSLALSGEAPRTIVELGVGTARVLGALGRSLADRDDIRFVGIDGSLELLARAADRYPEVPLELKEADFSGDQLADIVTPGTASLVLCVCASFSMLPDRASQAATLRNIAAMLSESGVAVIETHSPAFVRKIIGTEPTSMYIPYPRYETGLVCYSSVEDGIWRMRQVWLDRDESTTVVERSLLTEPGSLAELAGAAGLRVTEVSATFAGGAYAEPDSPLYAMTLALESSGPRP